MAELSIFFDMKPANNSLFCRETYFINSEVD